MRLGWRLGALGVVLIGLISVLTLRLWLLQVARGETFEDQVQEQQVKILDSAAPRGEIVDRNGLLLAGTRASQAIVVDRTLLPEEREEEVVQRLATLLDLTVLEIQAAFDGAGPDQRFRLAEDVAPADALFVQEHAEEFPGVTVELIPIRVYPEGSIAAHVVGYIGRPDDIDLDRPGIGPDDVVGKFGVEKEYDELLRGVRGKVKYRVNAARNIEAVIGEESALPGGTAHLTIDAELQGVLESALENGIELARDEGEPARRAAGVIIDPNDGSIRAMASIPSYDPNDFVGGLSAREWELQTSLGAFNNFAIQGVYPPASTFKAIAYVMALEDEIFPAEITAPSPDGNFFCSGRVEFNLGDESQQLFRDWKPDGHGLVDLHGALAESCDLYFWSLALSVWSGSGTRGELYDEAQIQSWANLLGYGSETGVDLPFEQKGLLPDREWFERTQEESPGLVRTGPWVGGDVMNIVIGQGAVTATPLQVANSYAAMVNGGVVYRPRVVDRVIDAEGTEIFFNEPRVEAELELDPLTVAFLKEDLRQVVNSGAGTARTAFETMPARARNQVGGKTGTAEIDQRRGINTAWFVGVAPIDDPEYVIAVVIDRGGSGGKVAAPTVRQVLEFVLLGTEPGETLSAGEATD